MESSWCADVPLGGFVRILLTSGVQHSSKKELILSEVNTIKQNRYIVTQKSIPLRSEGVTEVVWPVVAFLCFTNASFIYFLTIN